MLKKATLFFIIFLPVYCFAQKAKEKNFPESPKELAEKLTTGLTTEKEKAKSIFYWITNNISYKVSRYKPHRFVKPAVEDTGALKPLDERIAINVLTRREAVCDGYARLFKTLSDYAGLQSVVIHGYARTNDGRKSPFRANHSWNAVRIENEWYLLDVTWASGFIDSRTNTYVPRTDEKYFLTPPSQFIHDHYPENIEWTLLNNPPVMTEYKKSPFLHTAYRKNHIISFSPANGILEAYVGDTLFFEIETVGPERPLYVTEYFTEDSISGADYPLFAEKVKTAKKLNHKFVLHSPYTKWLNVVYNGEHILRYRVKINGANNGSMAKNPGD